MNCCFLPAQAKLQAETADSNEQASTEISTSISTDNISSQATSPLSEDVSQLAGATSPPSPSAALLPLVGTLNGSEVKTESMEQEEVQTQPPQAPSTDINNVEGDGESELMQQNNNTGWWVVGAGGDEDAFYV